MAPAASAYCAAGQLAYPLQRKHPHYYSSSPQRVLPRADVFYASCSQARFRPWRRLPPEAQEAPFPAPGLWRHFLANHSFPPSQISLSCGMRLPIRRQNPAYKAAGIVIFMPLFQPRTNYGFIRSEPDKCRLATKAQKWLPHWQFTPGKPHFPCWRQAHAHLTIMALYLQYAVQAASFPRFGPYQKMAALHGISDILAC